MKITSPAFSSGEFIPATFSYQGGNNSPPLEITDVPNAAKSLCMIVHDPDAPIGDYLHWMIWNINPKQESIGQGGQIKDATFGKNDFGNKRWDGPSPPSGIHRYIFELYALDNILDLDSDATREQLETAIKNHVIESAILTGLYRK